MFLLLNEALKETEYAGIGSQVLLVEFIVCLDLHQDHPAVGSQGLGAQEMSKQYCTPNQKYDGTKIVLIVGG